MKGITINTLLFLLLLTLACHVTEPNKKAHRIPDDETIACISDFGDMASSVAITYDCQELINLKTQGTFYVDWSPDKTMLVYCKHYNIENGIRVEIWTMNSDGSEQRRISGNDTLCALPEFSPSGDKIMYTAENRFSTRIVVCDVNGNFKKTVLTSFQATNIDTSCAYGMDWKNESEIIYIYWGRGMTGYMKAASYKMNSKEHFSLAFLDSLNPNFIQYSSETQKLALVGKGWPGEQAWTCDIDGANLKQVSHCFMVYSIDWSPDGEWLLLSQLTLSFEDFQSIWKVRADGSDLQQVMAFDDRGLYSACQ